jgi:hypothetical protein
MIQLPQRSVLTIATGKPIYIELAINLARSFKWWHKDSSIQFVMATDQKHLIPPDLSDIEIIELQPGQYGQGFSPKLHLDKLASTSQTLFVDADCLCVGSLESVFDRFAGHAVSVVGRTISEGEWFGEVATICSQFNIKALPRFNGGVYYLEPGDICTQVYSTARYLEPKYDEIGFTRLRNRPNDEVIMALSIAIHGQSPISEDGTIMNSTLACPGGLKIDVLKGEARLLNPYNHPNYNSWYELEEMNPVLVHFLSHHTTLHPYVREKIKLDLTMARGWSAWLARLWANIAFSYPWLIKKLFKDFLRPVYHKLLKPRTIKISERI